MDKNKKDILRGILGENKYREYLQFLLKNGKDIEKVYIDRKLLNLLESRYEKKTEKIKDLKKLLEKYEAMPLCSKKSGSCKHVKPAVKKPELTINFLNRIIRMYNTIAKSHTIGTKYNINDDLTVYLYSLIFPDNHLSMIAMMQNLGINSSTSEKRQKILKGNFIPKFYSNLYFIMIDEYGTIIEDILKDAISFWITSTCPSCTIENEVSDMSNKIYNIIMTEYSE